jgi:hypothetical protein
MKSRLFIGPLFVFVAKRPSCFTAPRLYHFSDFAFPLRWAVGSVLSR